uniref:CUB domain-containing protein n=1 Tax=Plectus sambesii TaxID=2011161 RepID=A0A914WXJ4_9BILA
MRVVVVALIFASLLPVAHSVCSCGNTTFSIVSQIGNQRIYNPQDDVTKADCATDCTYTVTYTPGNLRLVTTFVICTHSTNSDEMLTIYDGPAENNIILGSTTCVDGGGSPNISSTSSITIVLKAPTPASATPATFLLAISPTAANAPTTTTVTTTTMPITTPAYNSSCDPTRAQMDIAVLLDTSGVVDSMTFSQMNMFVQTQLLSAQMIQPNDSMKTQVTGGFISPICYLFGLSPEPWAWNSSDFTSYFQTVKQVSTQAPSCYSFLLGILGDHVLSSQSSSNPLRRNNAPALLYLLSGSGISAADLPTATTAATSMKNAGIRILTVEIGSPSSSIQGLATPGLHFSYPDGSTLMQKGMQDFLDNVTCNGNNFCGGCGMTATINSTTGAPFTLVPSSNRYCNTMNCNYTFTTSDNSNASVTFNWFDIEFERDYIEVFDGNNNGLALFSGYNVKGAQVIAGTPTIMIQFTSNPSNVYTGFNGTAIGVKASSTVRLFGESLPNP